MSPFTLKLPAVAPPPTLTEPVERMPSPPVPVVNVALVEPATLIEAEPLENEPTRTVPEPDCVSDVVAPATLSVPLEPAMPCVASFRSPARVIVELPVSATLPPLATAASPIPSDPVIAAEDVLF